jgi:hypothetical protein
MKTALTSSDTLNSQSKSTEVRTQLQTIFQFLSDKVATATEVSAATQVPQKNICRYKRDLQKNGHLAELRRVNCPITGFKAWLITCDPSRMPHNPQIKLF